MSMTRQSENLYCSRKGV